MVSLPDVTSGRVTLAEIVEINHYLEMKADMQNYINDKQREEAKHGRRPR